MSNQKLQKELERRMKIIDDLYQNFARKMAELKARQNKIIKELEKEKDERKIKSLKNKIKKIV